MYRVEMYARVRRACMVEGMGIREAAREYGLHRDTVRKMLRYSVPPGYRRSKPVRRPKLEPYVGVIDQLLEGGQGSAEEAAAHGEEDFREVEGGARVCGRLHHSEGLRAGEEAEDAGDVCAAEPCVGTRPVRLWAGEGDDRRGGAEDSLLRAGSAP